MVKTAACPVAVVVSASVMLPLALVFLASQDGQEGLVR